MRLQLDWRLKKQHDEIMCGPPPVVDDDTKDLVDQEESMKHAGVPTSLFREGNLYSYYEAIFE